MFAYENIYNWWAPATIIIPESIPLWPSECSASVFRILIITALGSRHPSWHMSIAFYVKWHAGKCGYKLTSFIKRYDSSYRHILCL